MGGLVGLVYAGALAQLQAKRAGYGDDIAEIERYINDNYTKVMDTLRTITVSHRAKDVFDSPLSRTINTAFFPFRFNMKVASLMAKQMSQFSAPVQVALLAKVFQISDWINSDEGLAWQAQYSDAIKLFQWLSPTYPLSYVMKLTSNVFNPEDASMGDLGLLGGLPFGMYAQMLEANDIITASAPYVDPQTGYVFPKYIPQTTIAQANLALQSLINMTFSYPGALIGLPSKTKLVQGLTDSVIGGREDFEEQPRDNQLSDRQKEQIELIKKMNGLDTGPTTVEIKDSKVVKVEPTAKVPQESATYTTTPKRKKKSDYIPRPINS
jgi:hypothetical protein